MPNFVTFDDGMTYHPLTAIEAFGHIGEGDYKGGTWIKLRTGDTIRSSWSVSKVAEMLGPVANLHY